MSRWASELRTPDWVAKPEKIGMLRVRPTLVLASLLPKKLGLSYRPGIALPYEARRPSVG